MSLDPSPRSPALDSALSPDGPIVMFDKVSLALEQKGIKPDSAEIAYIPVNTVSVTDLAVAKQLLKLHDALEDLDDVQEVFSNEDMDDALSDAARPH